MDKLEENQDVYSRPELSPANVEKKYKADEFFIVCIPSRTATMDINTVFTLASISEEIDKFRLISVSDTSPIHRTRTQCLRGLKKIMDASGIEYGDKVRTLWMDDDLMFKSPYTEVVNAIKQADKNNWDITANYRLAWEGTSYVNSIGLPTADPEKYKLVSDEEIAKWPDGMELPEGTVNGFGFVYCWTPIDYVFHFDRNIGEDFNFFRDTKMKLHYSNLKLLHKKSVLL